MKIHGRRVSKGTAEGEVLVSKEPLSFLGGVDPKTGIVTEKGHSIEGKTISDKILIFPKGKGSTVGAYVIYQLKKEGKSPAAIINLKADVMVASGAIIAGIPMIHRLEEDPLSLKEGTWVYVNANKGYIEVLD
jgi:predicted aconitase with swiveling domain